jgi:5-bromo-4-chloroindolyl phosphate hydrolysis protein
MAFNNNLYCLSIFAINCIDYYFSFKFNALFFLSHFQAQLKLAEHLKKMSEQGKDVDGMDVDLDELRAKLEKFKNSMNER